MNILPRVWVNTVSEHSTGVWVNTVSIYRYLSYPECDEHVHVSSLDVSEEVSLQFSLDTLYSFLLAQLESLDVGYLHTHRIVYTMYCIHNIYIYITTYTHITSHRIVYTMYCIHNIYYISQHTHTSHHSYTHVMCIHTAGFHLVGGSTFPPKIPSFTPKKVNCCGSFLLGMIIIISKCARLQFPPLPQKKLFPPQQIFFWMKLCTVHTHTHTHTLSLSLSLSLSHTHIHTHTHTSFLSLSCSVCSLWYSLQPTETNGELQLSHRHSFQWCKHSLIIFVQTHLPHLLLQPPALPLLLPNLTLQLHQL